MIRAGKIWIKPSHATHNFQGSVVRYPRCIESVFQHPARRICSSSIFNPSALLLPEARPAWVTLKNFKPRAWYTSDIYFRCVVSDNSLLTSLCEAGINQQVENRRRSDKQLKKIMQQKMQQCYLIDRSTGHS